MNKKVAIVTVLAVIAIAYAWKKDKLNAALPAKLRHRHEGFTGLNRSGQYVTAPGGGPGVPGTDLNTSAYA